jgi:hypothetical protein
LKAVYSPVRTRRFSSNDLRWGEAMRHHGEPDLGAA